MKRIIIKSWKSSLYKLAAIVMFFSLCAHSCDIKLLEKPEPTELPPKTQTGAHTFGCYVNGEIFVATMFSGPWDSPYLDALYIGSSKRLTVSGHGKMGWIQFDVRDPKVNEKVKLNSALFRPRGDISGFSGNNIGEFILTRFDKENLIVSGTFAFELSASDRPQIQITEGRFDIKISDYNFRE